MVELLAGGVVGLVVATGVTTGAGDVVVAALDVVGGAGASVDEVAGAVTELGLVLATELVDGTELTGVDTSSVAQAPTVVNATTTVTFHHQRTGEPPMNRSSVPQQTQDRAEGRSQRAIAGVG